MAAGLGFKDFTTGEVLTAADVDGYLMQGIWVFASTAARDAAVTAPAEGNFAFTKDTNSLWYYDGAAWVASGATGDIEGVTAGTGISGGGTSGTVTITNSMATAIDAKGDLIGGTGADTFARLAVGANDTVLTADSTETTGLKWAAAGGAAGLVKIGTTTFSSSSAVNINDVFSSTYDNYRVIATFSATPSADLLFRYRVSGADNTTSNYALQGQDVSSTSTNSFRLTAEDKGRFGVGAGDETGFAVDMFSPFLSRKKRNQSTSNRGTVATPEIAFFWNTFNATTSFTGLTIYPASGTVSGEISVYGYAK
jgi:hypothetical protein